MLINKNERLRAILPRTWPMSLCLEGTAHPRVTPCPPLVDQPQRLTPSRLQHSPGGRVQQARRKGHSLGGGTAICGHLSCCSHPRRQQGCSTQVAEVASNAVGSPSQKEAREHRPPPRGVTAVNQLIIRAAICPKNRSSPTGPEPRRHQRHVVRPRVGLLRGSCLAQTQV